LEEQSVVIVHEQTSPDEYNAKELQRLMGKTIISS